MHRKFAYLSGLALCGVLVGCSSSPSVPKHAPGPGPALPITVHAGRLASWTNPIAATFPIKRAGTYRYDLSYAHVPPQPGAQPQVCLSLVDFRLIDEGGTASVLKPVFDASGATTGTVQLSAGTWTGSSGASPSLEQEQGPSSPPPPPMGTFWSAACPWSLTLTPSK